MERRKWHNKKFFEKRRTALCINWLILLCLVWGVKANGVISAGHLLYPFSTATPFPMFNELNFGYADWEWTFSFAHVTDIHHHLDNLTEVVNWIIANHSMYKIKFVVITGDIVPSCILEHFYHVRDRLQPLLDNGIPYIILPGNHDMWEFTDTSECQYPNNNAYFREVFGPVLDSIRDMDYFENWDDGIRDSARWNPDADARDTNDLGAWNYFQCYTFDYGTYNFVVMDLNTQDHATWGKGSNPYAQSYIEVIDGPYVFLLKHLATNASRYTHDRIVIFMHQAWESSVAPIWFCWKNWCERWRIGNLLFPYREQIGAWICGHDHNNDVRDVVYNHEVICTQYITDALVEDNPISNALRIFICYGPPSGIEEEARSKEQEARLEVYPNPFSTKTVIRVCGSSFCQHESPPRIRIYDVAGRVIRTFTINGSLESSSGLTINEVVWDGTDNNGKQVSPGIYFCSLERKDAGQIEFVSTKLIRTR